MRPPVLRAREWVMCNREAIIAACGRGERGVSEKGAVIGDEISVEQAGWKAGTALPGPLSLWPARRASELILACRDAGLAVCAGTLTVLQGSGRRWSWEREDLLVHFACGGWPGMSLIAYTAAVALAMVSYFTGR